MRFLVFSVLLILTLSPSTALKAQACSSLDITLTAEIESSCDEIVMTSLHDQLDRSFLYVANKEAGLRIYDVSNSEMPILVQSVSTEEFEGLDVMSLEQQGSYLYLAVGNHFTNPEPGGLVVVDISNPEEAFVTDYYVVPNSSSGSGIVKLQGNFAFLAAMRSGVAVVDVSVKNDIKEASVFVPDVDFPIDNPNLNLINARGIDIVDDILFLCNDAGGFHTIDISDKTDLKALDKTANPVTYTPFNLPRAYNNIVIRDSLAYVAVDYCGVEVYNIVDPSDLTLVGWWNPQDCPNNNWFNTPSHANDLFINENCDQLFVSTGKSDMIVLDISNPTQPDSCNYYGGTENSIGTWGLSSYKDEIYLSYVCAIIPFTSNWSGLKILSYTQCSGSKVNEISEKAWTISPNPATNRIKLEGVNLKDLKSISINSITGTLVKHIESPKTDLLDILQLPEGIYIISLASNGNISSQKFVKH